MHINREKKNHDPAFPLVMDNQCTTSTPPVINSDSFILFQITHIASNIN